MERPAGDAYVAPRQVRLGVAVPTAGQNGAWLEGEHRVVLIHEARHVSQHCCELHVPYMGHEYHKWYDMHVPYEVILNREDIL